MDGIGVGRGAGAEGGAMGWVGRGGGSGRLGGGVTTMSASS